MWQAKTSLSFDAVRAALARRGAVVSGAWDIAGRPGGRHWHFRMPGRSGTLEVSAWDGEVWLSVHARRDGGWARDLAREIAGIGPQAPSS